MEKLFSSLSEFFSGKSNATVSVGIDKNSIIVAGVVVVVVTAIIVFMVRMTK